MWKYFQKNVIIIKNVLTLGSFYNTNKLNLPYCLKRIHTSHGRFSMGLVCSMTMICRWNKKTVGHGVFSTLWFLKGCWKISVEIFWTVKFKIFNLLVNNSTTVFVISFVFFLGNFTWRRTVYAVTRSLLGTEWTCELQASS